MSTINIFWFRRDLRLQDNTALYHALKSEKPVLPIFIFDTNILDQLPKDDARISFIHQTLKQIDTNLQNHHNSSLALYYQTPKETFTKLIHQYNIDTVYTNADYEPYAKQRDAEIKKLLEKNNIHFKTYKDQVLFEKNEVLKNDGTPYMVFTPYMKKWKSLSNEIEIKPYPSEQLLHHCIQNTNLPSISLQDMGFIHSSIDVEPYNIDQDLLTNYKNTRDIPGISGTSRLSPYLRFGLVGYRGLLLKAFSVSDQTFLNELIWREFYMAILDHFPNTVHKAFKPQYDAIQWRNDKKQFELWKTGQTGYPIVDAGMRQLNQTGWMHNRVRMIVGSFLCKHLLIDWRWGEAYFAQKLLDYEMSSNIGGWQWVAGSGVDAAPYFRIFNPYSQTAKFDPDLKYCKTWVPEYNSTSYPKPIVEHKFARLRCLEVYKEALTTS